MKKIVMTYGLPASGKSTWAKAFIKGDKDWVRVNNDELGNMMFGEIFAEGRSDTIDRVRKTFIEDAMEKKLNIVVDNTNLHPKHEEYLRKIIAAHNEVAQYDKKPELYELEIKDFSYVPVHECIVRNRKRDNPVPDKVIYNMNKQFLLKQAPTLKQDEKLPKCLLVDMDGTVALLNGRNPYSSKGLLNDLPNNFVIDLVKRYAADHKIFFVTGREIAAKEETEQWLANNGIPKGSYELHMRQHQPSDLVFKKEVFEKYIKDKYFVSFAIEDRNRIVSLYRHDIGIPCFQCADGDF